MSVRAPATHRSGRASAPTGLDVPFRITFEGLTDALTPGAEMRVVGIIAITPVIEKPAAATNVRLTALAADSVSIAWDAVTGATGYKVYRDDVLLDDVGVLVLTDDTVVASTTSVYKVVPYNSAGDSDETPAALSVDVPADEPDVPAAPVLTLVAVTSRSAEFQWAAVPNATGYKVYDGVTLLDTVTALGYLHSSLTPETDHSYTVVAFNDAGDGDASDALEITTLANNAPVWDLSDQSGTVGQFFSIDLALSVSDLDGESLTITLESGGVAGLSLAGTVYSGTPTTAGDYAPTFKVSDGIDETEVTIGFSVAAAVDTTPPTKPVISASVSGSSVTISLDTPSTDDAGIYRYVLSRKGPDTPGFALRASLAPSELPYVEAGVPAGDYQYRIRSEDDSPARNSSEYSDVVNATVASAPTVPDSPVGFLGIIQSGSRINLQWRAGPSGPAPTSYELRHSLSASGPWEVISTQSAPANRDDLATYSHTGISTTVDHHYSLRAVAGLATSAYVDIRVAGTGAAANFIIAANATVFDGSSVQPGQVVEFAPRSNGTGGGSQALIIRNLRGNTNNRIVLRAPTTGKATIRRSSNGSGGHVFRLENVQDVDCRFLSTDSSITAGPDGKRHGVKVMYADVASGNDNPSQWLKLGVMAGGSGYRGCRNITIDGLEVDGGWPSRSNNGIAVSSNDHSAKAADYPGVWQENLVFENLYLHDISKEGMYCGANPYLSFVSNQTEGTGRDIPIRNATIRHCWLENIGGEGINPKSWFDGDNSIHDNVIIKASVDAINGTGAINCNSAKVNIYNNYIEDPGFSAINWNISAGTNLDFPGSSSVFECDLYNNVIVKTAASPSGGDAIQAQHTSKNGQSVPASWYGRLRAFNNTVINFSGNAIDMRDAHPNSFARNNLAPGGTITFGPTTNNGSNVLTGTLAATFIDPTGNYKDGSSNFRLKVPKPASGTIGVDIAPLDLDGTTRVASSADVGAYEFQ